MGTIRVPTLDSLNILVGISASRREVRDDSYREEHRRSNYSASPLISHPSRSEFGVSATTP